MNRDTQISHRVALVSGFKALCNKGDTEFFADLLCVLDHRAGTTRLVDPSANAAVQLDDLHRIINQRIKVVDAGAKVVER